jgi:hypothetical protein
LTWTRRWSTALSRSARAARCRLHAAADAGARSPLPQPVCNADFVVTIDLDDELHYVSVMRASLATAHRAMLTLLAVTQVCPKAARR